MIFGLLGHAQARGSGGGGVTLGNQNTGGAKLIVLALTHQGPPMAAPTDSYGNVWTFAAAGQSAAGNYTALWYCINPITGSLHSFSTAQASGGIGVSWWSATGAIAKDQALASGTNSLGTTTPTTKNDALVFTAASSGGASGVNPGAPIGAGFTLIDYFDSTSTNYGLVSFYQFLATPTPLTITYNGGGSISCCYVSFVPSVTPLAAQPTISVSAQAELMVAVTPLASSVGLRVSTIATLTRAGRTAYEDAVLRDTPAAYYPLDDTGSDALAHDHSGNTATANYVGTVQYVRPGPSPAQNAITLAGAGYVDRVSADPVPVALSMEAWFRTTDPSNRPFVCGRGQFDSIGDGWMLFLEPAGNVRAYAQTGGVGIFDIGSQTTGAPSLADGGWHHVVVTWIGALGANGVKLYVDGALLVQNAAASAGPLTVPALPFRIGLESDGTAHPFRGDLACVAWYDHELPIERVGAHYTAMRGVFTSAYGALVLADGPVGYWRFDEAVGAIAAFDAAHTYHATRSGGVTFGAPALLPERGTAVALDGQHGTGLTISGAQPPIPAAFTLEVWFRMTGAPVDPFAYVWSSGSALTFPQEFALQKLSPTDVRLAYLVRFTDLAPGWIAVAPVPFNRWTYAAYTFDGTYLRVYLDGVQVYQTAAYAGHTFTNVGSSGGVRSLGWQGPGNNQAFIGQLDDLAWYDKALGPSRIAAHYAAGKRPLGKALTFAQGKIARGGATRGAYIDATTFMTIGGSHVGTAPVAGQRVLMASLSITDTLEQSPNTCTFTCTGFAPTVGQEVVITLGSKNALTRLFAGVILAIEEVALADNPQSAPNIAYACSAIDYTWLLDRRLVIAQYRNQSATAITLDLIARFSQGFTTRNVAPGLPVLDEITFTNTSLSAALTQLVKRIGGYYYVDYHRDLHLYIDQESALVVTPPTAITPAHKSMRHLTARRDLSQFVTRVLSEGGGSNASTLVSPGDTVLPVEDPVWYEASGNVVVGPQRVRYTQRVPGGGGSLIGPAASPSTPPNLAAVIGTGLAPGTYLYAMTFGTASGGETLPSPVASIVIGAGGIAPPQTAVSVQATVGQFGPEPGDYTYAVTFKAGAGETLAGPYSQSVATFDSIKARTDAPILADSGYAASGQSPGVYQYKFAWWDINGYVTEPGPAASYTLTLDRAQINGGFAPGIPPGMAGYAVLRTAANGTEFRHIFNSNQSPIYDGTDDAQWNARPVWTGPTSKWRKVIVGPLPVSPSPLVTARNIYRWRPGGDGQFHYVGTVANNDPNVGFGDQVSNASVGAVMPVAATAFAQQVTINGIAIGPATVAKRFLYRTAANGTQLKRLATINDNTSTGPLVDTAADGTLGANVPTTDTANLPTSAGQLTAGSTAIPTSSAAPFEAGGGWAILASGQKVRYGAISGNTLTGVPPSGPGAIVATVNYGSSITAIAMLAGIPASGDGAIAIAIKDGDQVNLLVTVDDLTAQQQLALYVGGDGVQETYLQDNRLSATEARARGQALLAQRNQLDVSVGFTSRDKNTRSGSTASVAIPLPMNIVGEFKIQQVTITLFQFPRTFPTFAVQASSSRFSFEDLLRLAQQAAVAPE